MKKEIYYADIQTTLNIYCHTTLQYKKEQVNRLQPFFRETGYHFMRNMLRSIADDKDRRKRI